MYTEVFRTKFENNQAVAILLKRTQTVFGTILAKRSSVHLIFAYINQIASTNDSKKILDTIITKFTQTFINSRLPELLVNWW